MELTEVRREILLAAPREAVWAALTDPAQLSEWFANDVELDVREGGEGVFRWANGEERRAVVEHVDPGRRLEFEWSNGEGATTVAFTLEDDDAGTRLTVVEAAASADLQASAEPVLGEWAWAIELLARIRPPAFARV